MTVRVVGLDLSATSTGVALPDGSCRTIRPHAGAKDRGRRLNEIVMRLDPFLRLGVDLALVEGPNLGAIPGRLAALILGEVRGAVKGRLFELDIPSVEIAPQQLKKFATGSGSASKEQMIDAARESLAVVANDDEADAWHLYALGRSQFSETWDPVFRAAELVDVRRQIRASIKWPALEGAR